MKLVEWAGMRVGSRVDVDGVYGAQCFDLVNDYVNVVYSLPRLAGAMAIDIAQDHVRWFRWVANGPDNYPLPGSIVVWRRDARAGTGAAGHCAVAILADDRRLLSLDQNWPTGAATSLVWHTYDGVVGWHEPVM